MAKQIQQTRLLWKSWNNDELGGECLGNSREVCEFHIPHVQDDNRVNVIRRCPSVARIVGPQNVYSHTNPTT